MGVWDVRLRGDGTVGEGVGHCVRCEIAKSFCMSEPDL